MSRLNAIDAQAIMNIRTMLIEDHERLLDGASAPESSLVKQRDVAMSFSRAIRALEEVLSEAAGVKFERGARGSD